MSIEARYEFLRQLARNAGALARGFWDHRAALTVELKGPQDFVSRADRDVETFIRGEIAAAFPGDGFLGEETAASFETGSDRLWIVDPIDGTHNFLRGIAYWNVSIAYAEGGARTLGAVYDPVHDELFHARRGGGAWRSGAAGDARIVAAETSSLTGAVISVGHSDRAPEPRYIALRQALMDASAAFRNFGAGALQLAHVADGRLDGFVELELASWDAMAGLLLVEEAGGCVAPFPGPQGLTARAPVIAAAAGIAAALTAIVRASTGLSAPEAVSRT
jgi:myo-inositol-1(or 4)-monophosphatase